MIRVLSRPSWARGLKLRLRAVSGGGRAVAPLVGARIETLAKARRYYYDVAPLVGARIETPPRPLARRGAGVSRPSWARGLKPAPGSGWTCRPVAPLVGARIETLTGLLQTDLFAVAPLVGARIETASTKRCSTSSTVAPLVGARIETDPRGRTRGRRGRSRPSWARGLKQVGVHVVLAVPPVAPLVGARIET